MADSSPQVKIKVNNGNAPFFYVGHILKEDAEFITIKDRKEGVIKISRIHIISIQEVIE